jgi:hypothetical protein
MTTPSDKAADYAVNQVVEDILKTHIISSSDDNLLNKLKLIIKKHLKNSHSKGFRTGINRAKELNL